MGVRTWLNKDLVRTRVRAAMIPRLEKCAILVEAEAKTLLNESALPVSGAETIVGAYVGSQPGQPPKKRSSNLYGSIQYARTASGTFVVGPTLSAHYGAALEFGAVIPVTDAMRAAWPGLAHRRLKSSTTTIHLAARPFMRPALAHCVRQFPELFANLDLGGAAKA